MEACEKGLTGDLPPAYYLASVDPGHGKTLALAEFLKAWRERGFPGQGGVLIGVSRLNEIKTYIEAANLDPDQFGVLTSTEEMNALGVSKGRLGDVPILFTTQQMILSRTRGKLFREATEFHFRGQSRALRIWDESLIPARTLSISRDDLGKLLSLRLRNPRYVEAIEGLMGVMACADEGTIVGVPADFASRPSLASSALGEPEGDEIESLTGTLASLAGKSAILVSEGGLGMALVTIDDGLPSDFAPVIIADASGRVRGTYAAWERHRGDLVRLPAAVSDYRNLDVRLWQRRSGKQAMEDLAARDEVIQSIVDEVNKDDEGEWLVIHYKQDEALITDLKARVANGPDRVRALHWGNHHGTNDFRHVRNVVLFGQITYRRSGYMALGLAAGVPAEQLSETDAAIREGELAHHYLQAACRGAVRKVANGIADDMRLFLIATPSLTIKNSLWRTFPGCSISDWNTENNLRGKVKLAADYLREQFSDPLVMRVRKREVREAIGIERTATFASHVMRNADFRYFLNGHWIDENGQSFERVQPFEVVDGYVFSPDDA